MLFILGILGIIIGIILIVILKYSKLKGDIEIIVLLALICMIILGIGGIFFYNPISYGINITAVEKKIALYERQNSIIDNEMQEIVSSTYNQEKDTMKSLKSKSASSMIMMFPKLKSIDLVNKQMDIYMSNKKKINDLREKEIDMEKVKILHKLF